LTVDLRRLGYSPASVLSARRPADHRQHFSLATRVTLPTLMASYGGNHPAHARIVSGAAGYQAPADIAAHRGFNRRLRCRISGWLPYPRRLPPRTRYGKTSTRGPRGRFSRAVGDRRL